MRPDPRLYGHSNLPDSSNICHETTSVALKQKIGAPVGTCTLDDFEHCDMLLFFGQNTGTNSPRFLHPLQAAAKRGCRIVTFNPVRERGLIEFMNPQSVEMVTGKGTQISDTYLQLRAGGNIAAIVGLCKHLFAIGAADCAFMAEHCHGAAELEAAMAALTWDEIEAHSGLSRADLVDAVARAKNVIGVYGMGLTQHIHGGQSIGMLMSRGRTSPSGRHVGVGP